MNLDFSCFHSPIRQTSYLYHQFTQSNDKDWFFFPLRRLFRIFKHWSSEKNYTIFFIESWKVRQIFQLEKFAKEVNRETFNILVEGERIKWLTRKEANISFSRRLCLVAFICIIAQLTRVGWLLSNISSSIFDANIYRQIFPREVVSADLWLLLPTPRPVETLVI